MSCGRQSSTPRPFRTPIGFDDHMRPLAKVGLVTAGYVVAIMVASAVVAIHVAGTSGPDRQAAAGMYGFGDDILFLAVFGVAGVPATGAALFFLRPHHGFWRLLSFAALGISTTGIAALAAYLAERVTEVNSILHTVSGLSPIRILIAPLFLPAFLLGGLLAPSRSTRIAFVLATGVETALIAYIALFWFQPFHVH